MNFIINYITKLKRNLMNLSENFIFIFSTFPHSDFYLHDIYRWFQSNESTSYKVIKDDYFLRSNYPPSVKIISTITNPWTRTLYNYTDYIKQTRKIIKLDNFVEELYKNKEYCKNHYDYVKLNEDYIFRNEFIQTDFLKLSKLYQNYNHLIISKLINFNHKKYFNSFSNSIIEDIFSKDIKEFYLNLIDN